MVFGVERCRKLLDNLDSPDEKLKIVHIAGTNGKGSVAEYASRILFAAGHKVGTFTTPQVYDYTDCFRVNCVPISLSELDCFLDMAARAADGLGATIFEIETAAALSAFVKNGCEYAVVECGLGGLLDATNAIRKKELALITSIGLEHTKILGETIEDICAQKSGIINNCPALATSLQPSAAREYFERIGVTIVGDGLKILRSDLSGTEFEFEGIGYFTKAIGCAQPYDAALAIAGAKILNMPLNAVYSGVNSANPQGRLQVFDIENKKIILDGAHNPSAFMPLCELLKKHSKRVRLVLSCLSDKDLRSSLAQFNGLADGVAVVESKSPRAMPIDKILSICQEFFPVVSAAESVQEAIESLFPLADILVVCGSFTILEDGKKWIDEKLSRR